MPAAVLMIRLMRTTTPVKTLMQTKTTIRKKLKIRVRNGVIRESKVGELKDELVDEMEETV